MSTENEKGPAPDIVLNDGALRAAAWREEGEYGPFWNTKITRRYTNADGDVRETSSLRERDLLPASELTAEAYRNIRERKRELTQERNRDRAQSEDWHDEDKTRKEIKRDRFKQDRRSRSQGRGQTQQQRQDY